MLNELEDFKNEAIKKMNDTSFYSSFLENGTTIRELWSRGPATSIVPYELEMAGITPSTMSVKEPTSKKNVYRYLFGDNGLQRTEVYNAKGQVHEAEVVCYVGARIYALRTNRHSENVWLKIAELHEGSVIRACRVDGDSEFWAFAYQWQGEALQEISSFSSNSVPAVKIYPEYSEGVGLVGMYFLRGETKVYVYQRQVRGLDKAAVEPGRRP